MFLKNFMRKISLVYKSKTLRSNTLQNLILKIFRSTA